MRNRYNLLQDSSMPQFIIGIDTGGTFTDFVIVDRKGTLNRWKVPSTPSDPSRAIIQGLNDVLGDCLGEPIEIIHGTTVGTNAFLERKGAETCLITTRGFEDVLFIGRQARPALYDLYAQKPRDIISRDAVLGVKERCNAKGEVLVKLDSQELDRCVEFIKEMSAQSVAVCFLHSYLNGENEERLGRFLEKKGLKVCLSSRLLPEFREFERTSTTVINAYLGPVVGNYIRSLEKRLPRASIMVQLSGGGCLPAAMVDDMAVATILSGPAGGVLASLALGKSLGIKNILTFDMGGTSTDVSLCPGQLVYTRDYKIEGFPINLPVIDVHTVGAGGGSIAWIDRGGLLKVGPQSAGADPGPICYGKGEEVTVTDANLFLGRLRADRFLGGRMGLQIDRVRKGIGELGSKLGLTPIETAIGIIRLVNLNMVQALRKVSMERGYDPREFHLISFGGAAGLHALSVAQELGISRVIIPHMAGVFSAQGLASSDLVFEASKGLFWKSSIHDVLVLKNAISGLEKAVMTQARSVLSRQKQQVNISSFVDARYLGQSFEITVPFKDGWQEAFHKEHKRLYGYSISQGVIEVTAVRTRLQVIREREGPFSQESPADDIHLFNKANPDSIAFEFSDIIFEKGPKRVAVIDRDVMPAGTLLKGPFLIVDDFTTILILEGWSVAKCNSHLIAFKDVIFNEN